MGILEKLRRKRSHPSQSIGEFVIEIPSPVNGNGKNAPDSELTDDEKTKATTPVHCQEPNREEGPLVDERDDSCIEVALSQSSEDEKKANHSERDCSSLVTQECHTQSNSNSLKESSRDETNGTEQIIRESPDDTIRLMGGSQDSDSENPILNRSFEVSSIGEITEVSDDNMLRDDEGNPIDPDEAEENMLRDDEGNIIDPKTLVVRDFLLDLSCESDEYYDDSGEKINPKELISVIDEKHPTVVTDSSTQSEGEGDAECDSDARVVPLHEKLSINIEECIKEKPRLSRRDAELYEDLETKSRRNQSSRRRRRRHRRDLPSGNDEYLHIMFDNKLCTLDEESSSKNQSDSGDEADDESPRSRNERQRSPRSNGTIDEKFIRARWEYSMQMMTCGSFRQNGEIIENLMMPAEAIDLEETGEI